VSEEISPFGEIPEEALRQEAAAWRLARSGCPDPDLLLARRSELLDADVHAALDDHIASCDACARLVADLESMKLDASDPAIESAVLARVLQRGSPTKFWRLPLSAALVIGCAASIAWWIRTPAASVSPAPVASASAAGAASAAPGGAMADKSVDKPVTTTVTMWTVEALPVRVPLSAVGVSRSAENRAASAALVDALAPYQAGRYADAVPALQEVARSYPESGEAALYLGVALLLADRPGDALAPLERAARQVETARRADVEWYRATAEQRAGRTSAARDRLAALCAAAGGYQQRACAATQALR
jgi:tetratricopeptide (TPR) repeat protein